MALFYICKLHMSQSCFEMINYNLVEKALDFDIETIQLLWFSQKIPSVVVRNEMTDFLK